MSGMMDKEENENDFLDKAEFMAATNGMRRWHLRCPNMMASYESYLFWQPLVCPIRERSHFSAFSRVLCWLFTKQWSEAMVEFLVLHRKSTLGVEKVNGVEDKV